VDSRRVGNLLGAAAFGLPQLLLQAADRFKTPRR
jgi:hypothetical protein